MTKRIQVTLTEDQIREISELLQQRQPDDTDEKMMFRWRIVKELKRQFALEKE